MLILDRFCNELGQRDYITEQILSLEPQYAKTKEWDACLPIPKCHLVLSVAAGEMAAKHIEFYVWKGFLTKVQGYQGVAESIGCSGEVVKKTLEEYKNSAQAGLDEFGRTHFGTTLDAIPSPDSHFYIGTVTPVLHYTMGGLQINAEGNVLRFDEVPITGLYACGETTGGVHGNNRLAGNSLLECVVYGVIVSQTILRHGIK
jgi:succinate dehydrogenase/fumarate reductase flavoprotein subunit